MKTFINSIAAIMMLTASAVVATSCSKEDDGYLPDNPSQPAQKAVKSVELTITFGANETLLKYFDITSNENVKVDVTESFKSVRLNNDGEVVKEYQMHPVTTIKVTGNSLPFKKELLMKFTPKENLKDIKPGESLAATSRYHYKVTFADNTTKSKTGTDNLHSFTAPTTEASMSRFQERAVEFFNKCFQINYEIDKNGCINQ